MPGPTDFSSGAKDVADLLARAAVEAPDRVALVEAAGRRTTWRDLDDEVDRLVTGLGACGIVAGHRVMLAMGNRTEFVAAYLAVLRAQAVAVPVNPGSTADELARMLTDSGTRMVFTDPGTVVACREAAARVGSAPRLVVVGATLLPGERGYDQLRLDRGRAVPPLQDPDKLAALLYTSGTSGRPRAAMLTHRALLANIEQVAAVDPPMIHGDDVVLGVLPLFHVYGLNAVLGSVLRHRARLVLAERFDPQATLDLIEDEACSVVPVAPPVFASWRAVAGLRERLGPVRLVLSGSAPLAGEVVEEFTARTGVPVHQGYGLTEAAPVVTSTLCSRDPQPGSVGAALPGVELRLGPAPRSMAAPAPRQPHPGGFADAAKTPGIRAFRRLASPRLGRRGHPPAITGHGLVDSDGRAAEGEDPGEVWVRGANLFSGYWPDRADGPHADGWWATGDVGFLDAGGDLFLVDRTRDLIIVSGFNVYPVEVEDVIREVPGVAVAAVIGVGDPVGGEAVVAYVVPTPGSGAAADLEAAVRAHCGVRLARFKHPSRLEVVTELPVGVTGKVQKGRLRGYERRRRLGLLE